MRLICKRATQFIRPKAFCQEDALTATRTVGAASIFEDELQQDVTGKIQDHDGMIKI